MTYQKNIITRQIYLINIIHLENVKQKEIFGTKCIVNPKNVIVCGVHRVKKYDKNKYTEYLLNNKTCYFIHFFNFSGGWGGRDKRNPLKNEQQVSRHNTLN